MIITSGSHPLHQISTLTGLKEEKKSKKEEEPEIYKSFVLHIAVMIIYGSSLLLKYYPLTSHTLNTSRLYFCFVKGGGMS